METGTSISVSQVLECLSIGMTAQEIAKDYPGFPAESVPEVLRFAFSPCGCLITISRNNCLEEAH